MHLIEKRLRKAWPSSRWSDVTVVLAVSGGPDSVALLRACQSSRGPGLGRIIVAHYQHGLREAGQQDAEFTSQLCRSLNLECTVGTGEVLQLAEQMGDGMEAAARQARYHFLTETARRYGARYVATGHTADDQAETILHRLARGTGIRGLAGIPRARQLADGIALIRPLLRVRRSEVLDYLTSIGQDYRVDESNLQTTFCRNRIRNEILPALARDVHPNVVNSLTRLGELARRYQEFVDQTVERQFRERASVSQTEGTIDCTAIECQPRLITRELFMRLWREMNWPLKDMRYRDWKRLEQLAHAGHLAQFHLPGKILAKYHDGRLRLTKE